MLQPPFRITRGTCRHSCPILIIIICHKSLCLHLEPAGLLVQQMAQVHKLLCILRTLPYSIR